MFLQYSVCILFGLFGLYLAAPADSNSKLAKILKFDYEDSGKGPYSYGFESSDGITKEESGELHYAGTKNEFMKVTGVFAYPGPDGVMYEVRYTADDQGFHPEGDHIKVPPFVPWIHHHDDETNDIGPDDSSDSETGQSNIFKTTPKPVTEYLPSQSTTYLPSTTPKPEYTSGESILDTNRVPSQGCLQSLPCSIEEQEGFGSTPSVNSVYIPSSVGPIQPDDALSQNILSTPRPNPEVHFHSTARPPLESMDSQMMLIVDSMGARFIDTSKFK